MSMKKTDLEKHLAKKLDGRMKARAIPQRFGKDSAAATEPSASKARPAAPKLVAVACRLPADLVNRLRERAVGFDGGLSALMALAVGQWLASDDGAPPGTA